MSSARCGVRRSLVAVSIPLTVMLLGTGTLSAQSSFLDGSPQLRGQLLAWEKTAPNAVKNDVATLRTGSAIEKSYAAIRLGNLGPRATGGILALLETLTDNVVLNSHTTTTNGRGSIAASSGTTSPADEARNALERIGTPAVEPLILALRGANGNVRRHAVRALGAIRDRRAIAPLIGTMRTELLLWEAATAVEKIDSDWRQHATTQELVIESIALLKHADSMRRVLAAKILGVLRSPRSTAPLLESLADAEPDVRTAAVHALREIRDPSAVERLIIALNDQREDADVRASAAFALGQIGDPRATSPLIAVLEEPELVRLITLRSNDRRRSILLGAIEALADLRDLRAVGPLIATLRTSRLVDGVDSAAFVRNECLSALETLTGQRLGLDPDAWARWLQSGAAK